MDVLQLPPLLLRTDLIRRSLSSEIIFRTYLPTLYSDLIRRSFRTSSSSYIPHM